MGYKPKDPALLAYLKELGCAFQGNLGSFQGWYGPDVKKTADYLKQEGFYTHFGTDAHSIRSISHMQSRNLNLKT